MDTRQVVAMLWTGEGWAPNNALQPKAARLSARVRLLEKGGMAMFEKERFIEECRAALKERDTHAAVRELVARAVSEPMQIVRAASPT